MASYVLKHDSLIKLIIQSYIEGIKSSNGPRLYNRMRLKQDVYRKSYRDVKDLMQDSQKLPKADKMQKRYQPVF